ncbi:tubulin epsilon and delta complex protein 1 isoform X2 [Podarcis raffonei]|uniref:tubulin epsilon and delta complex protein 1 isoform X2 n=1 Tax=Podarcis raffonei TaxID=65483 RepID=UPI0023291399|nr:tubulin epsilon and delta complex protein 1 isoform X2 [Podarcis raffonei]
MAARAASASRLPAAVGALGAALPGPRVPPEAFRLAKLGRPHATVVFWKLLYSLLKQFQGGGWMEPADTGTQVRFVRSVALSLGYRRPEFYQLPPDGSEGSRELLLVFSWLLCRISLMEQLLALNRVKLWDEATVCMCDTPLKSLQDGESLVPKSHMKNQRDVRYLQWLNGRLQFQWRKCHTEQEEQCKLLNKLLQLVESNSSRLEAFLKWKLLEPVYWHWMETLFSPETEDAKPHNTFNKDTILPGADLYCYGIKRTIQELDRYRKDLLTLYDGLGELIAYRKLSCCGTVRAREQLGESEFCTAVKKTQDVVELKLSDLKCHSSGNRIGAMHGPYRLVFKGKCLKTSKTVRSAKPQKSIAEGATATDVIRDLRKKEARLKVELKRRQEEGRQKVYEAAQGLGQVLCIPPMKRAQTKDAN